MASEVDICNLALQKLGEDNRILSLSDDTKAGRELALAYPMQRDAELRSHHWKFALARAELAADPAPPAASPYGRQFLLPADFLKLVELQDYRLPAPTEPEQYQFRKGPAGTMIETDLGAPLRIRYVELVEDVGRYDPLFVQLLACSVAMAVCEPITQSLNKLAAIERQYAHWLDRAETTDAIEKAPEPMFESSWTASRF